jgi:flavin reductase (DIM6/NTAB) family NADH-FMN oxidoreductase RutF
MSKSTATAPDHSSHRFERIELDRMDFDARYRILSGSVIPRPIAFVSTLNADGIVNVAPFSSFMIASVEAGYLAFSVGPSPSKPKETLVNIRRTRQFVINTVSENLASQVQLCGDEHPAHVSKVEIAGLRLMPSEKIDAPRIVEAKVQFECRLHRVIRFGDSHMVVGLVLLIHVQDGIMVDGKIDPLRYAALGRIAGRNYCRMGEIISV